MPIIWALRTAGNAARFVARGGRPESDGERRSRQATDLDRDSIILSSEDEASLCVSVEGVGMQPVGSKEESLKGPPAHSVLYPKGHDEMRLDDLKQKGREERARMLFEVMFRIANALAIVAGLFMVGSGLYLQFADKEAGASNLIRILRLHSVENAFRLVGQFPAWLMSVGLVLTCLGSVSIVCTGWRRSSIYYTIYSHVLLTLAILMFVTVATFTLTVSAIDSDDYQKIRIFGTDITYGLELGWMKGVRKSPKVMCQLQSALQCAGFYDAQCSVPTEETSEITQSDMKGLHSCPGQTEMLTATGSLQSLTQTMNNITRNEPLEITVWNKAGHNVTECLANEMYSTEGNKMGCLRTMAAILDQTSTALFVPGIVVGSYMVFLVLIASVLQCFQYPCRYCG